MVTESEPSPFCLPFWPDFCLPFWPEPYICYYICGVHKVFLAGMSLYSHIRCIHVTFGRKITLYTIVCSVYIRFWPTLIFCVCLVVFAFQFSITVLPPMWWSNDPSCLHCDDPMCCIQCVVSNLLPPMCCLQCVASNVMNCRPCQSPSNLRLKGPPAIKPSCQTKKSSSAKHSSSTCDQVLRRRPSHACVCACDVWCVMCDVCMCMCMCMWGVCVIFVK